MEIANPFALFCQPAQYFMILIFFDFIYIAFFTVGKKRKIITMKLRCILFFILCLCGIGWSFVINYACGYQQYVAWGLAALPVLYLTFKQYL